MKEDIERLYSLLGEAAKGIVALEQDVAALQADAHAYRMLIGTLLLHSSPGARDEAAWLHATAAEWTLPFSLTEAQRERLQATLGRTLQAVRETMERRSRPD